MRFRLQMGLSPASSRSTCGSVGRSRWRATRGAPRQKTRMESRRSVQKSGRPSTYHATVWSRSTSALWPPPARWYRACWRSSGCWTILASSHCTGRRTETDRVRNRPPTCYLMHNMPNKSLMFLSLLFRYRLVPEAPSVWTSSCPEVDSRTRSWAAHLCPKGKRDWRGWGEGALKHVQSCKYNAFQEQNFLFFTFCYITTKISWSILLSILLCDRLMQSSAIV